MTEQRLMTVDEYLEFDSKATTKHEYMAGRVYAMDDVTIRHNVITQNLLIEISRHLAGGPCEVFFSEIKVHFKISEADIFYYPDVMVTSVALDLEESELREPKLIIEVISPSTDSIDRREKAFTYQQIPSLEEYVVVAQHVPEITIHRRAENWAPQRLRELNNVAEFRSIALSLRLDKVYERALTELPPMPEDFPDEIPDYSPEPIKDL